MRNAFADELTKLASKDPRIFLCSGDIGNNLFNEYKQAVPKQFLNCGVAEANMIGVCAGMAASGLRPLAYTITPFLITRALEQIRNDLCYQDLPVVLVSVGAAFCYAELGPTHHAAEDIAFLRALPNMTVLCPADAVETRLALRAAFMHDGPVYIRLGKKNEPVVHEREPDFTIGKAITVREGEDVVLLSAGITLPIALEAAEALRKEGVSVRVVSFHTVKPLDEDCLKEAFSRFKAVVTIEEHGRIGGFGSAVAEWLADQGPSSVPLLRVGSDDEFLHECRSQAQVRERYGISATAIAERVRKALE